jgi:hypothetical protein
VGRDRPEDDHLAAPWKGRLADENERVERVTVLADRALDEAVVRPDRSSRGRAAVDNDGSELPVQLVLVP